MEDFGLYSIRFIVCKYMPHASVKTIRDLIYWEYAKLISGSTTGDRRNYAFVMHAYQSLRAGATHPSAIIRENKMLVGAEKACAYCGATDESLEWEHIIPKSKIVIDTLDNQVLACRSCNAKKGARDPFEWYGLERRYEVPRLVLGKYLKLIYELHEKQGTLDAQGLRGGEKINVYDLGVVLQS